MGKTLGLKVEKLGRSYTHTHKIYVARESHISICLNFIGRRLLSISDNYLAKDKG